MKLTRPQIPSKPVHCRICGDQIMFPYSKYESEGGDDWICSKRCDQTYTVLKEKSDEINQNP